MRFMVINRETSRTMVSILDGKGDTEGTRSNWKPDPRTFARGFKLLRSARARDSVGKREESSAVAEYVGDSALKIFRIGDDLTIRI